MSILYIILHQDSPSFKFIFNAFFATSTDKATLFDLS